MSLLIPNRDQLNMKLKKFADHINADEVSFHKLNSFHGACNV